MKKQQIYDLFKQHFLNDDQGFLITAKKITRELNMMGEKEFANKLNSLINDNIKITHSAVKTEDTFFINESMSQYLELVETSLKANAFNKIFIHGKPGTGKTMFVKTISEKIGRELIELNINTVLDYRLGESMKNLEQIFKESEHKIIFIDEVDSIASKRNGGRDLFEINRLLNTVLKLIDGLSPDTILFVSTNLFTSIDEAFIRRFDFVLNFDNYTKNDLLKIIPFFINKLNVTISEEVLKYFTNIIENTYEIWSPSYIEKAIKLISVWERSNKSANIPLLQVMLSFDVRKSRDDLRNMLLEHKVPVRTVAWLFKENNEKNN